MMERIMATKKTPSTTRPSAVVARRKKPAPSTLATSTPAEHIRVRAYFLSLERSGCEADPIADWLRAERELTTGSGEV
jgi:hypothetical protein